MEVAEGVRISDSKGHELIGSLLEQGSVEELIEVAAKVEDISWTQVAALAAQVSENRARMRGWEGDQTAAKKSLDEAKKYREFSNRLGLKDIPMNKGLIPSEDEKKKIFGEAALKVGQGKPRR